jgi:hypothetical protein
MRACMLCGSEVKGDFERGYYCKRCNLLFEEKDTRLIREKEIPLKIKETIPEKKAEKEIIIAEPEKEPEKFITSAKAKCYHVENCPFAQKIRRAKIIEFKAREDAEKQGYTPCKCLKNYSNSAKIKKTPYALGIFVTSAKAKRYHIESCPLAQKIHAEKRIVFKAQEDAEKQGYKPCECLKDYSVSKR